MLKGIPEYEPPPYNLKSSMKKDFTHSVAEDLESNWKKMDKKIVGTKTVISRDLVIQYKYSPCFHYGQINSQQPRNLTKNKAPLIWMNAV